MIFGGASLPTEPAPKITWRRSDGAVAYDVWISNLGTNTSAVRRATISGDSYVPNLPLPIGQYRVWVRSIDAGGDPSVWSVPATFRVNTLVALHVPERAQPTPRPTLSWDALPGAVRYDLWIDNLSTGQSQFVRSSALTTTSWTATTDFPFGRYRIWVRGIDAGGGTAAWSNFQQILVLTRT